MLFKDVVGQEAIKIQLVQSVTRDRISHAQLFYGKEGLGKFPLALAYAQFILCQNKNDYDSCGICPSCLKSKNLSHPDITFSFPVQILDGKKTSDIFIKEWREMMLENSYSTESDWYKKNGNEKKKGIIGVDESKNILKKLSLKSFEGGYKIHVIWLAENMNDSAANKLLKIIEEPPKNTLIILLVGEIESILQTIISRTQRVNLQNILEEEIKNSLIEKKNISSSKASEIASYVNGNYSYALEQTENHSDENFDLFVSWMRLCFKKDIPGAIAFTTEIQKLGKEKQKTFLLFTLSIFQKSLTGNFTGMENVKTAATHKKFIENFMPYVHLKNMEELHQQMTDAYYHIDRNANAKILFLDLSFILFRLIKK